jgi:hypothetical protein
MSFLGSQPVSQSVALAALAWKCYSVYIRCLASFIAIIYFLFPQTKSRSLEEIAEVFDGPAAEMRRIGRLASPLWKG